MVNQPYKACPVCQAPTALATPVCGRCGHQFRTQFPQPDQTQMFPPNNQPSPTQQLYAYPPIAYQEQKSKLAAALLAFFLGAFGVHGFYLGNTTMGVTLLVVYISSLALSLFGIGILGLFAVGGICLVQAILYACATDHDFHLKYVIEKRWF